ncbi:16S rRNA (adenine(1518)-N(6)/adenine(1519)-N(6))-dimethyltransferase [Aphanothece hegewaldii CCALA 016]|uniref:Ribosomal RNA small subunit methyltransferase A n=1 Tax=Aphanothece hegewaldii CCALA 016 TaxID=2107694 RepID=A0A2T1LXW6_9CHRO|nr:16S rRNA (adenine(1518)-N(6)/adenine(1519)-N(6))-dimethyltransferase RsmA [Aphanothece hegewaldii]PSF37146.1 16S rRNA (adenine(1518)-N(6)/adenine(1519)-N(6))-dimethyltransferase [Aphanothece hegewaldii CCALA 016]
MSIRPRKQFGQHWLKSEYALDQIIEAAELKQSDRILEIGPGTGILTRRLLKTAGVVVAVEIDRDLCTKLVKTFANQENFLLLQGDILSLDLDSHLTSFPKFAHPNKVVANIPYNITSPILEKLLGSVAKPAANPYCTIVLLIQKEVAERLVAKPATKAYNGLSVKTQYLASCEWITDVPARAFYPPPKVDSAVIRLRPQPSQETVDNPKKLENLINMGFANRRKMLRNNLKGIIDGDLLTQILEQLEINPHCRAEELSLEQWIALSSAILINHAT